MIMCKLDHCLQWNTCSASAVITLAAYIAESVGQQCNVCRAYAQTDSPGAVPMQPVYILTLLSEDRDASSYQIKQDWQTGLDVWAVTVGTARRLLASRC